VLSVPTAVAFRIVDVAFAGATQAVPGAALHSGVAALLTSHFWNPARVEKLIAAGVVCGTFAGLIVCV